MKNTKHIETLVSWMKARRMSINTIKVYESFVVKFNLFVDEDLSRISRKQVQDYIFSIPDKYSDSYRNQAVNAIKLFFKVCKDVNLTFTELPRPKKSKFIPNVLEIDEMHRVIFNTKNIKHRALLFVMYDNGLRISELLNLTLFDVITKSEEPHLVIRNSKNNSSDNIYLSDNCIQMIKEYYRELKPTKFLFESLKSEKYSKSSVRNVLNAALKRENISKRIRVHDIRHSISYHLLLNGTDIYHLSKFLRHRSIRTTEEYYSHIQNINLELKRPVFTIKTTDLNQRNVAI